MADSLDLRKEVHRLSGPDYAQGYTAPETLGGTTLAYADTLAAGVSGNGGGRGPCMSGAPNDFGWRQQSRAEFGAYRESCVSLSQQDGATIVLSPDIVQIYEIKAAGSVTFSFADGVEGYDPPAPLAERANFVRSVVVMVQRQASGTITWPSTVQWDQTLPASTFDPPTAARVDQYLLVFYPTLGVFGYVTAQGFAPQSALT